MFLRETDIYNRLANNTLFTRWRPTSHFMAPHSWMNDPCGPSYDPSSGLYHLFYQFHPAHIAWGNISWGHATSTDLVTWTDVTAWEGYDAVAIAPGPPGTLDHLSVFSGSAQFLPVSANQTWGLPIECDNCSNVLLAFYTAVQHLPTAWNLPYTPGTETQVLAFSTDGGRTFSKFADASPAVNPVIAGPPAGLNVTGFRDPFFEPWPEMDAILGVGPDDPHWYAVLGSGIKEVGPRLQFYTAPAANLTQWTYLGPLFAAAGNASWSERFSGSYGYNFEVAGAFSLRERVEDGGDGASVHHFVTMGSEGGNTTLHPLVHWPLWAEIDVARAENGSAASKTLSSGVLDWGESYAWNSFYDAPHDRRLIFGWIPEDLNVLQPQGWAGAITLPRELFVQVYHDLANTDDVLSQNGSWTAAQEADGRWTMKTLGIRPAPDVVDALRENATYTHLENVMLNVSNSAEPQFVNLNITSASLIIHAEIDIPAGSTASVGFVLRRSPDGEEQAVVVYDPVAETLTIDLSNSTTLNASYANTAAHVAPLFLLDTYAPNSTCAASGEDGDEDEDEEGTTREPLTLDIVLDNSVVEVFGNARAALVGRTYPARGDSLGVGYLVGPGSGSIAFRTLEVWEGLARAWPGRPENSSMPLVFDTPAESGNYTWWTGE